MSDPYDRYSFARDYRLLDSEPMAQDKWPIMFDRSAGDWVPFAGTLGDWSDAIPVWTEYSLEQKQRLQQVLFPEGVQFSDGGFRTTATSMIFNLLQQPQAEKARMAAPTGFELVLR